MSNGKIAAALGLGLKFLVSGVCHGVIAMTLICGLSLLPKTGVAQAAAVELDIPAQPVSSALVEFARQAELQLVYPAEVAVDKDSKGVSGVLPADQALRRLLEGTGLEFEYANEGTIAIRRRNGGKSSNSLIGPRPKKGVRLAQAATSGRRDASEADTVVLVDDEGVLEEIIVMARRREERLQEVPISISAFSADDLRERSVDDLSEIGQITPNLTYFQHAQSGNSAGLIYIRGVGQSDTLVTNDPGVGVYVDGIYMGRMEGLNIDLVDIERIEVLRGPQGTLFGKNTIGGAVSIVSARPTDELGYVVDLGTGGRSRADGRVSINIPLAEGRLAAKFSGVTRNRGGYGSRLDFATGNEVEGVANENSLAGRALISWRASDQVEALFSFDASRVREAGPARKTTAYNDDAGLVQLINDFVTPPYGTLFMTDNSFDSFSTGGNRYDSDSIGLSAVVDWDLGNWSIESITAYRDNEVVSDTDPDGTSHTIIEKTGLTNQDQFSQELRFSGETANGKLVWTTGVYFFREEADSETALEILDPLRDAIGLDLGFTHDLPPLSGPTPMREFGAGLCPAFQAGA